MTLPTDPIYLNDIANAQRERDTTLAGLGQQRTATALEYGYTPTYDENGFVKALAIDPNDPYAKAAVMQKSYEDNLRNTKQSFASRGQLYSGALGVGQSINDQNYAQGSSNLQNSFINFIARNQGAINAANTGLTNASANALSGAVERASAADTGSNAPGPAAPAAPAMNPLPGLQSLPLSTGFAGLDPKKKYRQASNGKLQVQNSNGTWRYV